MVCDADVCHTLRESYVGNTVITLQERKIWHATFFCWFPGLPTAGFCWFMLVSSCLHELHESQLPFLSRTEFIRP